MSVANKLLQAASGNAGDPVYVDDVFSTYLYDGTSATLSINNGIDLNGEGGLVWIKQRNSSNNHLVIDTERGATKTIFPNSTYQEVTYSTGLTSFNNNGFTLGNENSHNLSGIDFVSWTFRKQEKFFDIVTYTGNGTAGRTISHNLGSVPGMMIVKSTSNGEAWEVYHRKADASAPEDKYLQLNGTGSVGDSSFRWNDTAPTATEFTVGGANEVNGNGMTYVAYLFAHNEQDFGENSDEAIIHCGSYTGTGSYSSPPVINLGFEPQWVMLKNATSNGDWVICDVMRGATSQIIGSAGTAKRLNANNTNAETSYTGGYIPVSPTPTGFTMSIDGSEGNASGATYIYMAISRPHKPASEFAATDLFAVANATTNAPLFASSFPVDAGWYLISSNTKAMYMGSRLQGPKYLLTHSTAAEVTNNDHEWDFMDGWYNNSFADTNYVSYMLRRAKGFCDVVAYAGNGTGGMGSGDTQVISHNLGVAPEYIIVKRRSGASDWIHWTKDIGAANRLFGDAGALLTSSPGHYFGTSGPTPTATTFTVGDAYYTNSSGSNYIAYLFASVNGVSKVGTYTGTGSDLNVDCGFSAGVRFVFIKRTDSSGNWYVYDSVRGIVAGNDPYFLLNIGAVDVTNTDYIDPLNAGFTITSSAPADLNASGGTYIFLAIA